jgi:hypothetical protein
MAGPEDVQDMELRACLQEAGRLLDEGDYLGCVRMSVEAYSRLAAQRPGAIVRPPAAGQPVSASGGTPGNRARAWPSHMGVSLAFEGDLPRLKLEKDRFSLSEAASYFEYTVEQVVKSQG